MATLYIEEFASLPALSNGQAIQAGLQPSVAAQTVAIGAASAQSSAFNASTKFVRLHTDVVCSYLFGADPTATATSPRMPADATEYFAVIAGQKVAVIENT